MTDTRSLTVELPDSLIRLVEEKVVSGEYASASEVVRESLEAFEAEPEGPSDEWLRREALPVLDACRRDPSRLLSSDEVFDRLERKYLTAQGNPERNS